VLLGIAWLFSQDKRRALAQPRILLWGLGLQVGMAFFALDTPVGARFFVAANDLANGFVGFADSGIDFVFGHWPDLITVATPDPAAPGGQRPVVVGFLYILFCHS